MTYPDYRSEAHRDYHRKDMRTRRRAKYGLTNEQFAHMFARQLGRCAICQKQWPGDADSPNKDVQIDHDHDTGLVRSLLCSACNLGIGSMQDNPSLCRAAATYLERHLCLVAKRPI
jgi:hypothetical protein